MKPLIKTAPNQPYAVLSGTKNEYKIKVGSRQLGTVGECTELLITCSPKDFMQVTSENLHNLSNLVRLCKSQLGQEFNDSVYLNQLGKAF